MTNSVQKIIDGIGIFNKNPSSIQQLCLDALEEVLAGDDIVDPTSPFMFLLEAASTTSAAAIAESESTTRKLYPVLAQRQSELYRHMSDKDYVDRFAKPAAATLKLLIPLSQLVNYAVDDPNTPTSAIRSVRIPRNTYFEVNGYRMGIHYPIRIDLLNNSLKGIQVVYETDIISPLKTLKSNVLEKRLVVIDRTEYLEISVPVEQFSIDSTVYPLEGTSGFQRAIPFSNEFLYARAYVDKGVSEWEEIKTTHSLQVYDPMVATLALEVHEGSLFVTLPDIYQNNGLAGNSLRLDIFTTEGPLSLDLGEIASGNFSWTWEDLDTFADTTLVAPLEKITGIILYSDGYLSGGADALTLEELRERVIYGVGSSKAPITAGDVEIGLKVLDYNVVRYIDNVTDRLFIASKHLPYRERNGLATTIRASNTMVTFDENVTGFDRSLVNHPVTSRATVLPDALYDVGDDEVRLLSDSELNALEALAPIPLVTALNDTNYFYSPFHYVLDYSSGIFKVRPYLLSKPSITGRTFEDNNKAIDYNLTTKSVTVELVDDRFVVTVIANDPSKLVFNGGTLLAQLMFTDTQGSYGYLNATATLDTDSTVKFIFEVETSFDVSEENQIEMTNLIGASTAIFPVFMDLESTFSLFYFHESDPTGFPNDFSTSYDTTLFANPVIGATWETLTIEFGRYLDKLYAPNRSIAGTTVYQTYPADVPAVYEETVYASGPYGTAFTVNPDDSVSLTVLHNIGDPVLDGSNQPIMAHYAGDYVRDVGGNLIVESEGTVQRHVGITLIDAIYRYGTTDEVVAYNDQIPLDILNYLDNEISPAADLLAERTRLQYKPRDSAREVRVYLGGGITEIVSSLLDFKVTYYLTNIGLNDLELRSSLTTLTRNEISKAVRNVTLSASNLETILEGLGGDEVLSVEVERFGESKSIPIMTLVETDKSFSVRELITQLPDGSLDVRDAIDVVFTSAV